MASSPSPVKSLLAHHPGSAVPWASFLDCPLLSWAALYCCCMGERVSPLLVSVLVRRWRSCMVVAGVWCVGGGVHSEWCQRCCW